MISVLRTAVLEVSTVQIPSLRLLSTRPTVTPTVTHTHRVSSFPLLSGKTWLSSFPLEGKGVQLKGTRSGAMPICPGKLGETP